ncbi:hypothetical protein [Sinomicrobium sp. M5D2P17]
MTKNYSLKVYAPILLLFFLILSGCSGDDDNVITLENFYKGALTSAKTEDLAGIWSVYEVEYEGEKTSVPVSYQGCGRDFFVFMENGKYSQYAANSEWCNYDTDATNWSLNEGIIYIGPSVPQSEEMVLVGLNKDKLIFRMKIDMDEDGTLDILTFTAQRYAPPNDPDIYTASFQWDDSSEHQDKIRLKWMKYQGLNNFEKYEIYRSSGECNKNNVELIGTITDKDQDFFIDEEPPAQEELCYFFRLYTDKGLVGESFPAQVFTHYLEATPVALYPPEVVNDAIKLHWETYKGYYFSHYEITVGAANYDDSPLNEMVVAKIEDINTTTFTDNNPPYVVDPVYSVYVYDTFGFKSFVSTDINSKKATYTKPGVLPFDTVEFVAIDSEETIIYLAAEGDLYRYNYSMQAIEAKSDIFPNSFTSTPIQVVKSADYGKEIIYHAHSELYVYDAGSLKLKYKLKAENHLSFYHFIYLHDNLWLLTDSDYVYTCKREANTFTLIDKVPHFTAHQGDANYYPIAINNNQVIVGHNEEPQSIKFTLDGNGQLAERENVNFRMRSSYDLKIMYNPQQDYLADFVNKKLYTADNFTVFRSFEEPRFPSGISADGNLILGSNNSPAWPWPENDQPERKALIYDVSSQMVNTYETKGYPHLLFENHLRQIVSISSGLKRDRLDGQLYQPDIFVEIVE